MDSLPVDEALPRLQEALAERNAAVWWRRPAPARRRACRWHCSTRLAEGRKIVMQEPRRLAARAARAPHGRDTGRAGRRDGGLSRALDSKVGPRTSIEVVTDGLFLRGCRTIRRSTVSAA
jgi:ATP-dependent helicase HrpB